MYTRLCLRGNNSFRKLHRLLGNRNAHTKENNVTNSVIHGFVCTGAEHIPEYDLVAYTFQHQSTKTPYLHLERDDSNNVFAVAFRTTPKDSMGAPHILEHTVLCGSEKYPVRDPFFKMLNRSLATFMNALTGPDYTFYPFSTQNEVDYRNLQRVYLDAVFKPRIDRLDFLQEGWRLEHANIDDKSSPLTFKGVVFNEMKGALSETGSLFGHKFFNAILPLGPYGYCSGGDPLYIPHLTHEYLKKFHATYYHPSNSRIFSYGNFPLEKHLEIVNEYLMEYNYLPSEFSAVQIQKRWSEPVKEKISCRVDQFGGPVSKQNQIAIGYLTSDITQTYDTFVLSTLTELLTIGPNSPFYKNLIEKNISGGYNILTGYDNQIRDTLFTIGLKDVEQHYLPEVEKIVDETFEQVYEKGFESSHIDSVIHGLELSIKHQSPKFGMNVLFNIVPLWNHDGNVVEALKVNNMLKILKSDLRNPNFVKTAIQQNFLQNKHKLIMTMTPDPKFDEKYNQQESKLLNEKVKNLSLADKLQIYNEGLALAAAQNSAQNFDVLPCLKIEDIVLNKTAPPITHTKFGTIPSQLCAGNTHGVTYFKGILGIDTLKEEERKLIPFFNYILDKFDTKTYNYRDLDKFISTCSSGLSVITHITEHIDMPGQYEQGILLSSHCLDENLPKMMSIYKEIFQKPDFSNKDRMKMLLTNYCSSLTTGVVSSGHTYAMQAARALVSHVEQCKENLLGIHHVIYMQEVLHESNIDQVQDIMGIIANKVLKGSNMRTAFNYSPGNENVLKEIETFCTDISPTSPKRDINAINWSDSDPTIEQNQALVISMKIPVNFCAKAIPTVPYVHPDHAKLKVLSRFLSSKYLHPIVREKNGAYGGGAVLNLDGIFNFYSYRDPNTRVTLDVFDAAVDWMTANEGLATDQILFESKLSVLQQMDQPIAEHMKGIDLFVYGLSYDIWKTQRQRVLDVTHTDLIQTCYKYLQPNAYSGKCVLGDTSIEKLQRDSEKWDEIVGPHQQ